MAWVLDQFLQYKRNLGLLLSINTSDFILSFFRGRYNVFFMYAGAGSREHLSLEALFQWLLEDGKMHESNERFVKPNQNNKTVSVKKQYKIPTR